MAKHNETGARGEQRAAQFFEKQGYCILHLNWRFHRIEVDIIAEKDGNLVFVEVKTRSGTGFGFPEEAVTPKKQTSLQMAANAFIAAHPQYKSVRFDIVAILLRGNSVQELVHWEDAFW